MNGVSEGCQHRRLLEGAELKYRNLQLDHPSPNLPALPGEEAVRQRDALGDGRHVFHNASVLRKAVAGDLFRLRSNVATKERDFGVCFDWLTRYCEAIDRRGHFVAPRPGASRASPSDSGAVVWLATSLVHTARATSLS